MPFQSPRHPKNFTNIRLFYGICENAKKTTSWQNGYQYFQSDEGTLFITKSYAEGLDGKYSEQDAKVRESESPTFPDDWTTDVRSHYGNEPIENKMKKKKEYGNEPIENKMKKKKEIDPTPDYSRLL